MSDAQLSDLRRHGFGVAYRMLGSVPDAEDVVQEALLRYTRTDDRVEEPAAWMTTVATRLAIDRLRSARARREAYVGPWLPDPIVDESAPGPSERAELADSLSQAFLVVLEQLTPAERAAFLLREVFDYGYTEIAEILARTEASCRQLVTRARRHLAARRPRFDADAAARDALLDRFLAAAEEGDLASLEALLAEDAILYSDGGGKAVAALKPVYGAAKIARFMAGTTRKRRERGGFVERRVTVNGQPGRMIRDTAGTIHDVLAVDVAEGRIQAVRIMRNPDKLAHLD